MPKKVTNEKLAQMIKNGFDEVHEKIDKVDLKLSKKINKVKVDLNKKIGKVNKNLESRISQIDSKLDAEVERHDDQDMRAKNHEERIIVVEKKLEKV